MFFLFAQATGTTAATGFAGGREESILVVLGDRVISTSYMHSGNAVPSVQWPPKCRQ